MWIARNLYKLLNYRMISIKHKIHHLYTYMLGHEADQGTPYKGQPSKNRRTSGFG